MCRIVTALSALTFCLLLAGCGDGSVEVKTKSGGDSPTVIQEKKIIVKEQPVIIEKPTETKKIIIEKR